MKTLQRFLLHHVKDDTKNFCSIAKMWYIYNYTHIHVETKSTIMTNEHTSLEKYTSHTLFERVAKGLCVRGELENEQTATYWPQVPLSLAALLSRFARLLNWGSWRPSPLWELVLSTASYLQLTEPVCGTRLYNCLMPTCSLWASHLHSTQPVHSQSYTLISLTRCTCYLHRCISYLTAWPRVNMLHFYFDL